MMVDNICVNKVFCKILLQPFNIQRRLIRKEEKDFLPGPIVTGLWGVVLNRKSIGLVWI